MIVLNPPALALTASLAIALAGCASTPSQNRTLPSPGRTADIEEVSIPEYREFLEQLANAVDEDVPRAYNDKEKEQFNDISVELDELLSRYDSKDEMDEDSRTRLFNLHSRLEAVVVGLEDNHVLCKRRHRVGTNFKVTECKTVETWRYERDLSQEMFRRFFFSDAGRPTGTP